MLALNRVNVEREFFRISVQDAIEAIRTAMLDIAGITAWSKAPLHRLRSKDRVILSLRRTDVFVLLAYTNLASSSPGSP
jgi:hypothetical protein